jgi:hypothetical protein
VLLAGVAVGVAAVALSHTLQSDAAPSAEADAANDHQLPRAFTLHVTEIMQLESEMLGLQAELQQVNATIARLQAELAASAALRATVDEGVASATRVSNMLEDRLQRLTASADGASRGASLALTYAEDTADDLRRLLAGTPDSLLSGLPARLSRLELAALFALTSPTGGSEFAHTGSNRWLQMCLPEGSALLQPNTTRAITAAAHTGRPMLDFKLSIAWQAGGAQDNLGLGVAATDAALFVVGGNDNAMAGGPRQWDAIIARYDHDGSMRWRLVVGTVLEDQARSIAVTDAALFVAGWTFGAFPDRRKLGGSDAFVLSYDLDGNLRCGGSCSLAPKRTTTPGPLLRSPAGLLSPGLKALSFFWPATTLRARQSGMSISTRAATLWDARLPWMAAQLLSRATPPVPCPLLPIWAARTSLWPATILILGSASGCSSLAARPTTLAAVLH